MHHHHHPKKYVPQKSKKVHRSLKDTGVPIKKKKKIFISADESLKSSRNSYKKKYIKRHMNIFVFESHKAHI